MHGVKAPVGADATTALVERLALAPAEVDDGRAGPEAQAGAPGEVFADSAWAVPTSAFSRPYAPAHRSHNPLSHMVGGEGLEPPTLSV